MKRCPECDTIYEDHVQLCLADGASLLDDPTAKHTGTPAAVALSSQATPVPSEPEKGSSMPSAAILGCGGLALLIGIGLAAWSFLPPTGQADPEPTKGEITVEAPKPPPLPAPPPDPEPVPEAPVIEIATDPEGATVTENDMEVCTTPCSIDHPASAPLPRTFVVSLDGYDDEEYVVDEAGGKHNLRLAKVASRPRPVRQPRPSPRPSPQPGPRPAPTPTPSPAPIAAPTPAPAPAPAPAPEPQIGELEEVRNPFD